MWQPSSRLGQTADCGPVVLPQQPDHERQLAAVARRGLAAMLRTLGRGGAVHAQFDDSRVNAAVVITGERRHIFYRGLSWPLALVDTLYVGSEGDDVEGGLRAPMPKPTRSTVPRRTLVRRSERWDDGATGQVPKPIEPRSVHDESTSCPCPPSPDDGGGCRYHLGISRRGGCGHGRKAVDEFDVLGKEQARPLCPHHPTDVWHDRVPPCHVRQHQLQPRAPE